MHLLFCRISEMDLFLCKINIDKIMIYGNITKKEVSI